MKQLFAFVLILAIGLAACQNEPGAAIGIDGLKKGDYVEVDFELANDCESEWVEIYVNDDYQTHLSNGDNKSVLIGLNKIYTYQFRYSDNSMSGVYSLGPFDADTLISINIPCYN